MNITKLVGSVIYAWFPDHTSSLRPGQKFRPCLIVDIDLDSNKVLLAYGTSQQTERQDRGQFTIKKSEMPSLTKDTKFSLCSRLWLPITAEFIYRSANDPRIEVCGQVPRSMATRLLRALEEANNI
ncbi:MAG: toxin of addiction system [Gammaproteobacteria bacterium]|nr:MAG: toxin of addiction system [Gammaproteobacteria bacterium]